MVCLSPSKAYFDFDNIPQKYKDIAPADRINGAECFKQLLSDTDVSYVICRDKRDELDYPAFYRTGIHWSRTFEQITRAAIIQKIEEINHCSYREPINNEVKASSTPFYNEKDIFNLMNIWDGCLSETYYEFVEQYEEKRRLDKLRILIQGTSFSDGLRLFMQKAMPFDDIFYINRNKYVINNEGEILPFSDWKQLDFDAYLDNVDVICIESTESELENNSYGFVGFLLEYLDHYTPTDASHMYQKDLSADSALKWNSDTVKGVFEGDGRYCWTQKEFNVVLEDDGIAKSGLEIDFSVCGELLNNDEKQAIVKLWVNGIKVGEEVYDSPGDKTIRIDPAFIEENPIYGHDIVNVEVHSSGSFVPREAGMGDDSRELALALYYVEA